MQFCGVTIISSACELVRVDIEDNVNYCESSTFVHPSRIEVINFALSKMRSIFSSFAFEDETDENGTTLAEFEAELEAGHDICIQGPDSHYAFEFFIQNVEGNLFNKDDYIAAKLWCDRDIEMALKDKGYEGTDEQIADVVNTGLLKALNDCTDEDWEIINYAIDNAELA